MCLHPFLDTEVARRLVSHEGSFLHFEMAVDTICSQSVIGETLSGCLRVTILYERFLSERQRAIEKVASAPVTKLFEAIADFKSDMLALANLTQNAMAKDSLDAVVMTIRFRDVVIEKEVRDLQAHVHFDVQVLLRSKTLGCPNGPEPLPWETEFFNIHEDTDDHNMNPQAMEHMKSARVTCNEFLRAENATSSFDVVALMQKKLNTLCAFDAAFKFIEIGVATALGGQQGFDILAQRVKDMCPSSPCTLR